MTEYIDNALGLNTLPVVVDDHVNLPLAVDTQQIDDDVHYARSNLYDAVAKSKQAVDDMLLIAQGSQHPKAYEVLNAAIKTLADISSGIVDLQIKKQRLNGGRDTPAEIQTVNNLFVGSTAELQQMLEKMKNGEDIK